VLELEPLAVELLLGLVLVVPGLVLLPLLVLGVSLRTCLVTVSQHFIIVPEDVALGGVVVLGVWAEAIPILAVSIAPAISPIPIVRMSAVSFLVADEPGEPSP
jgi:hypothetical protein